ncbi:DUF1353 domain-containing protein [Ornithinimicrobium sp. INDO-MA30-4]|uniref:DUF1353 domain-containing protein n=1 Tax=Ornithinimicrobium sp. INDO-MA30-4 TaxID=2908651 RepID=UPI001F2673DF|nr:DUF1353 domain-containing protein [Ornithinimicrobium sp. INDO-MA30-4]UJH70652.1 DUF1353 domain-containing protein [Ornithinimicrobium sp. INDO-MA30-4]
MGDFTDTQTGGPLRLELRSVDGRDFSVLRQISYHSDRFDDCFTVPADLATFTTDLASVPTVFTWLVPVSGTFLPAAVLHDALLDDAYLGPRVDRIKADLIFRESMIELGTGTVRAWLMWSAVTVGTMRKSPSIARKIVLWMLIGVIAVLGALATGDLFDVWSVLPWMGDRPLWQELALGGLFAVLIPPVLASSWGKQWAAGTIVGLALAVLLHVTLVLLALYAGYEALERLLRKRQVR